MVALKSKPKVYWIWNHRRWCLEKVPNGPGEEGDSAVGWKKSAWDQELYVVEKLLDADARNCASISVPLTYTNSPAWSSLPVLAWNYRRYVLASMPIPRPETSELAYTSKKIQANFSNFSAWHQRSKVLPRLWESGALNEQKSRDEGSYDHHRKLRDQRVTIHRIRACQKCDVYRPRWPERMGVPSMAGRIQCVMLHHVVYDKP